MRTTFTSSNIAEKISPNQTERSNIQIRKVQPLVQKVISSPAMLQGRFFLPQKMQAILGLEAVKREKQTVGLKRRPIASPLATFRPWTATNMYPISLKNQHNKKRSNIQIKKSPTSQSTQVIASRKNVGGFFCISSCPAAITGKISHAPSR
jgi:hypothetical protein